MWERAFIKVCLTNEKRGPHTLRKYFRTQTALLGVLSDHIEYVMSQGSALTMTCV